MAFPHVFPSLLFLLDKEDIWNKQQNVLFAKQGATVFVRHNLSEGENKQLFLCGVWGNNSTQGLVASRKRVWPGIGWPAGVVSKLYWSVAVADWLAFRNMVSICKSLWIDWEWFKTLSSSYDSRGTAEPEIKRPSAIGPLCESPFAFSAGWISVSGSSSWVLNLGLSICPSVSRF